MAQGRTNASIADRLCLSEKTVETHIRSILQKLGVAVTARTAIAACWRCWPTCGIRASTDRRSGAGSEDPARAGDRSVARMPTRTHLAAGLLADVRRPRSAADRRGQDRDPPRLRAAGLLHLHRRRRHGEPRAARRPAPGRATSWRSTRCLFTGTHRKHAKRATMSNHLECTFGTGSRSPTASVGSRSVAPFCASAATR